MNFEKLIDLPIGIARLAGEGVLRATCLLFPATPTIETKAANITIYSTRPEVQDDTATSD